MGNQTISGPTQTAVAGAANEWAPRPVLAGATRLAIFILPYMVGFTFAVVVSRAFPASRLDIHPVAWFVGVAVISTLLMIPTDRMVRRLVPMTGLLTVALGFPDAAPSRFKAAMRGATTAQVQRRIDAALVSDGARADLDRNQYLLDLVSLLTRHDRLTRGHSERVRAYSTLMGEELRLSKSEQQKLYWAGLLHDIGKLDVPSEVLNKDSRPDKDEWAILQAHPDAAERYLAPLQGWLGDWGKAATEHHLRWDGKGYPTDIGGTDISFAGRIVAIADAYDVMTSARTYKKPMSAADARVELSRCAGGQFDPHLVRAFLNIGLGRVRVAGGVLASLPALVNAFLGSLATNGGRVLLATTAVTGGVAAAPLVDIVPPAPIEIVVEAPGLELASFLRVATPTPVPSPTTMQVGSVAAPVIVVPATPTPMPNIDPELGESPLFDFELEEADMGTLSRPAPVVVVPATPTPTATARPRATPVPTSTVASFELLVSDDNSGSNPTATATSTVGPTATPNPTTTWEPLEMAIPATPVPTSTRVPTATPTPTLTPAPTATASPVPTATATPVPTATATPLPTPKSTPERTPTPVPTSTPTPVPTATPGGLQPAGDDCAAALAGVFGQSGGDLVNCDLSGMDLREADLAGANLQGANLVGADLQGVDLTGASAQGANFQEANVADADFDEAKLQGTNFSGAIAIGADMSNAKLQGANLSNADFTGATFDEAKMQEVDLTGAILRDALLINVDLQDATLTDADLRGANFKDATLFRATAQNSQIEGSQFVGTDLREVDFTGAIGTPADDAQGAQFDNTVCPDGSVQGGDGCWG